jgi:hypothetical protein
MVKTTKTATATNEGYIDNLYCIENYIFDRKMTNATFDTKCEESFIAKEQIYPPHSGFATTATTGIDLEKQCMKPNIWNFILVIIIR